VKPRKSLERPNLRDEALFKVFCKEIKLCITLRSSLVGAAHSMQSPISPGKGEGGSEGVVFEIANQTV